MGRALTTLVVGMMLAGPARYLVAQETPDLRRSIGNVRPDSNRTARPIQGSTRPHSDGLGQHADDGHHGHHRGYHRGKGHGYGDHHWRRHYGHGYGLYTPYGYSYVDPYYYPPYDHWPPVYLPPLLLPAETIYGPEAVKRFMGIYPGGAATEPNVIAAPDEPPVADQEPPPGRSTNAEAVALGRKFIGFGDARFIEQDYGQAYVRYKKAAEAAPRLAQAYFRQGWALVASGRYELAADAWKKGLTLEPDWPESDFRLVELYGPNRAAKTAHVDALAAAATDEPQNGDLLYLIGTFLYFDGQPDRAKPFFQKAADLAPGRVAHLTGFLDELSKADL